MKRRWPGRPKQAPGHDDSARVNLNARWYVNHATAQEVRVIA